MKKKSGFVDSGFVKSMWWARYYMRLFVSDPLRPLWACTWDDLMPLNLCLLTEPGRPNDENPPEIRSFSLFVLISRFFQSNVQHFPLRWLLAVDFQNSSNCCTHKYDQSISRFFKNLIFGAILQFGPIVWCRGRLLESSLTTTESCCREKTWFTYVVCIR